MQCRAAVPGFTQRARASRAKGPGPAAGAMRPRGDAEGSGGLEGGLGAWAGRGGVGGPLRAGAGLALPIRERAGG